MTSKIILAAATLTVASLAAAEQPPQSDVEARLAALEKINVTAYKPQAENSADKTKDPRVEAIVAKATRVEVESSNPAAH